jgi:hypothetical protein
MTIQVDIQSREILEELVALVATGEDVALSRDGEVLAMVTKVEPVAAVTRVPGVWAHLGPMDDPDIFSRPDPEFEELAESRDEDDFYR